MNNLDLSLDQLKALSKNCVITHKELRDSYLNEGDEKWQRQA